MFSFSLLAKIALVSAERTPLKKLLQQKRKNPNGAVTVVCRRVSTNFGSSAHSLFCKQVSRDDADKEGSEDDEADSETGAADGDDRPRRASLSMILGVLPGSVASEKYSSKQLPLESKRNDLSEDEIIALRHEFFGTHVAAGTFHDIKRTSTSCYGDLEKLLKPLYEESTIDIDDPFPDLPLNEDNEDMRQHVPFASARLPARRSLSDRSNGTMSSRRDDTVSDIDEDRISTEESTLPTDVDASGYLEFGDGHNTKFRVNSKGDMYMSCENGKFKRCSKDMSLYYDMLTEEETMSSMVHSRSSGDHHDLTAIDLFRSVKDTSGDEDKLGEGETSSTERVKERQKKMDENSQFIDVLVRATELHLREAPKLQNKQHFLGEFLHK